jgi:hypothetical protein
MWVSSTIKENKQDGKNVVELRSTKQKARAKRGPPKKSL